MREQLPALCHFYGIKPWEIDLMTTGELHEFTKQLAEANDPDLETRRQETMDGIWQRLNVKQQQRDALGLGPPPTFRHKESPDYRPYSWMDSQ